MTPVDVTLASTVGQDYDRKSLLDYLCGRFRYRDRAGWQAEIGLRRLKLNGRTVDATATVRFKDTVAYTAPRNEPPVATDMPVLYEDEHLLVISKPAPLPVHSDGVFITNTAINLLRVAHKNPNLGLGHRLDRETSGVLVLAKNKAMISKVMHGFDESTVEKQYLAVCRGTAIFKEELVRGGMGGDPDSVLDLRQVLFAPGTPNTKDSSTRFIVREQLKDFTLMLCQPLTGRTNQIRVHLEHVGLPIAGDKLYGRPDQFYLDFIKHVKAGGGQDFAGRVEHPRHLLHAWKLGMRHPVSGERMMFEAPMPKDMEEFVAAHRA